MFSINEIWYRRHILAYLLWPLSLLFWLGISLRRQLYAFGLFKTVRQGVPVIVVGNLTVGGTGKTPAVIALVHWLQSQGFRPGVVSRGYGRDHPHRIHEVKKFDSAELVGDEALVMMRHLDAPFVLGRNRAAAAQYLLSHFDCNVIVSDDGLQHYRLGRDIEIVMIDGTRRFGNGMLLPAGPLREPRQRAKHADFTMVVNGRPQNGEYSLSIRVAGCRKVGAPEQCRSLQSFSSQPVHAFAAIGNPARFFAELDKNQIDYKAHRLPDHHRYSAEDFARIETKTILMTEKDAVKCAHIALADAWYVEIESDLPMALKKALLHKLRSGLLIHG